MELFCLHGRAVLSKFRHLLLIHVVLLQLSTLQAQGNEAKIISLEGDRTVVPLGQSVSYTCTVDEGRTEWVFGPKSRYTLNTYSHTGSIPLDDSINVSLSSYIDAGNNYVSILTIPSTAVIQLNDTDITCKVKPSEFGTAFGPRHLRIQVFGSPTSPGDVRVLSRRDLEVTLTWDPSFLPFNITPQYNVYVDGVLEGSVDQPMFKLSRAERSCNLYEILVEAFNEVGRNRTELVNVTLPSVPDVTGLVESVRIIKSSGHVVITISFEHQAKSCEAGSITNYSVTVTSKSSGPITRMTPAPPTQESVSITVEGLSENTLYAYQIRAHNSVGSTVTEKKPFYTTDVHRVTAMEMKQGTLFLSCEFVQGSNALGCQVNLETLTRVGNLTHTLYRNPDDTRVDKLIDIGANLSCYDRLVVFDIESDNTTSRLGVPGSIQANESRPCTAPLEVTESAITQPIIIGISVSVAVLLVITVLILVLICCLLKNPSLCKGSLVKDKNVWVNDDYVVSYPQETKRNSDDSIDSSREGAQENKLPIYDAVENFRPTSSESGSQDYQLLRRDLGRSLPLPPSPQGTEQTSSDYSSLKPEPYSEPLRPPPPPAKSYEVPAYAEPYQSPEPVYQTLEDSTTRKAPPPTTPPPSYYSEVADALPGNRRPKPIGKSSAFTLPQHRSTSRNSLSQV